MNQIDKWSIDIEGSYTDSFVYSGLLFLADFDGNIRMFDFENLIRTRLEKEKSAQYRQNFERIFLRKYQNNRDIESSNILDNSYLQIDIDFLNQFQESAFNCNEWVTDINITSNIVYFSSANGLESRRLLFQKKELNKKGNILFNEAKVFSFDKSETNNRLVLCCGEEGAVYNIIVEQNRLRYINDNKEKNWIDCQWSDNNESETVLSICSQDNLLYNQNMKNFSIGFFDKINKKKISDKRKDKLKDYFSNKIAQCFKNDIENSESYYEQEDKEIIFKSRRLNNIKHENFKYLNFIQRNDELFYQINENEKSMKISKDGEEISNWRIFPKAKTHFNQIHIIYNDHICINGLNINHNKY
ncbi:MULTISPECIES: hypothetical protein [unclassified Neisseria]|uniref:hypothetical protein n=1 Tax=unclassified Neisseria TaxID=2623750 RepID=UPI002665C417|nr:MULTISPECIES: hypothetical protein [unclassified Neisseria]MDO1509211.1 hypothetical protein [Neisseria sp. MVDL19-042950]MDO1515510.1 hypothetical protein [Neisseria sp. MVDL18-041461]MDO1562869.1 hypothetical protein [Neisseria sp. MVDL20-010259]